MSFRPLILPCALAAALVLAAGCGKSGDGGSAQKTTGQVESFAGSVTGDQHLKNQGKKDEVVGGVKTAFGDAKDAVHDAAHPN